MHPDANYLEQLEPNQVVCKCGVTLAAVIVYKRKYKRNRTRSFCPRCSAGFTYANLPKIELGKVGAYALDMQVIKEASLC